MGLRQHGVTNGDWALSRRQMLRRAAAAGAGLPLLHHLSPDEAQAQNRTQFPPFTVPTPVFSLAERNRRWAAVRANMARPAWNLDAIITAGSDALGNNARYLTQITIGKYSQTAPDVLTVSENDDRLVAGRVEYDAAGTKIAGYMVRPKGGGKHPAIIVVHENRGLNPHIEHVARRSLWKDSSCSHRTCCPRWGERRPTRMRR